MASLTQTAYRVTRTLPADRTLYARVGARLGGVYRWSENIPFRAAPVTATLVYPTANAVDVLLTRSVEWTTVPGADQYVLYIGTAPGAGDLLGIGGLTQTSYRLTSPLPSDRTLYVRVGARLAGVYKWSEIVPFRAAPVTATVLYPTANATDITITRDFEWTGVLGADAYVLHIGTSPGTWDVLGVGGLTQTAYRVSAALPSDRLLYARVGSRVGGVYRWSATIAFRAAPQ